MFLLLLLMVYLSGGGCHAGNSTSTLSRIPEILQELCPGANVCPENLTYQGKEYTFAPGYGSCCVDCSCSSDCGENGNCCYPYKLKHQEEGENAGLQKKHTCLFTVYPEPPEKDRVLYQPYSMVTSISEKVHVSFRSVSRTSCGEENVAPWGSLYPVYSAKSKQIYKNSACAEEDGVTDGIAWDAVLTCNDNYDLIKLDASSFVLGLDSNFINSECTVNFVYRGSTEDIQSLKCYKDPIDYCSDTEFKIPDETEISKEDIIEMCSSGLLSPYRRGKIYANVFCYICNNLYFMREAICQDQLEPDKGFDERFVGLLDAKFINDARKKTARHTQDLPIACRVGNRADCRPIHCPSGQLRDAIGKCMHPNRLWYDQGYTVYINLTTEKAINVTDIFKVPSEFANGYLPDFVSPWPRGWIIHTIYTYDDILDGGNKHASFLFILKRILSKVKPSNIINTVKKMVKRKWTLQHKNSTFVLQSDISSHSNAYPISRREDFGFFFGNHSERIYKLLYHDTRRFPRNKHFITKLYFCDQVELSLHEVILGPQKTILYNTITKRHLFDAEFSFLWNSAYKEVRPRICIEDSNMYETGSHSGADWCSEIYCVRVIAAALLLFATVKG